MNTATPVQITCECGEVALKLSEKPILSLLCFCDDCQKGSRMLEELPETPTLRETDGSTAYVLWREDHVEILKGEKLLKKHRLHQDSPTDQIATSCCNTPI
jgi:hypothetical protein